MIKSVAILSLTFGAFMMASCEDDPLVTPTGDDDDDCTGSYCRLDMNGSKTIAIHLPKNNPEKF